MGMGMLVLAAVLFLTGVLVGRFSLSSTPDSDELQKWLMEQIRQEKEQEEQALSRIPILSYEDLKETGDLHVANPDQKPDAPAGKKKNTKKKRFTKKAPNKVKKSAPKIQTAEKERKYTIQVGAFRNVKHALEVKERLNESGFDARFWKKPAADGGTWYIVKLGRYKNRREVASAIRKLKEAGFGNPMIVRIK